MNDYLRNALIGAVAGGVGGGTLASYTNDEDDPMWDEILAGAVTGAGAGVAGEYFLGQDDKVEDDPVAASPSRQYAQRGPQNGSGPGMYRQVPSQQLTPEQITTIMRLRSARRNARYAGALEDVLADIRKEAAAEYDMMKNAGLGNKMMAEAALKAKFARELLYKKLKTMLAR